MSWTAGKVVDFLQIRNRLYIVNGHDNLAYYDVENDSLHDFSGITTPGTPSLDARAVLTTGQYNNYYRFSAYNEVGETAAGTALNIDTDKPREQWASDGSESVSMTVSRVTGANGYNVYYFLGS